MTPAVRTQRLTLQFLENMKPLQFLFLLFQAPKVVGGLQLHRSVCS